MPERTNTEKAAGSGPSSKQPLDATERTRQWIDRLHCWIVSDWQPLPGWARFYLHLGACLPDLLAGRAHQMIVTLAVPARDYVVPLLAAGFIARRAHDPANASAHLQEILALPEGAPVWLFRDGRKFKGKKERTIVLAGSPKFIGVNIETEGKTVHLIPVEAAGSIQAADNDSFSLPKHQHGRAIERASRLVKTLLNSAAARAFENNQQLECLLVGQLSKITVEVCEAQLAVKGSGNAFVTGTLQDIAKVCEATKAATGYRSRVLPTSTSYRPDIGRQLTPPLVLFDGANSYTKWHEVWRGTSQIVILDRTESGFEYATEIVKLSYSRRIEAKPSTLPITAPPAGVELMLYEVAR
jgi:hypothetical protein